MGNAPASLTGPDLTRGFRLSDIKDGSMLLGHAFGEAVLLIRRGDEAFAVSAFCTHYGAPLAEGIVSGDRLHCPWHHACFDIRSGAPLSPPALNGLTSWVVESTDGQVYVRGKKEVASPARQAIVSQETFVIVGAGAAGLVAAETLRNEGFGGRVVLIGEDPNLPYDRPNLSKDYLAGNAPEEWIPLRPTEFYSERGIETRTGTTVTRLDLNSSSVLLSSGESLKYTKLLIATGTRPIFLPTPGSSLPHVHYLRTLTDSRAIIEKTSRAKRAAVIGSSFIGLEVAAALRARGLEVTVIGKERIPFERTLGPELGTFIQELHESRGVKFHLQQSPQEITAKHVVLADGTRVDADLVVIGVGVVPQTEIAEAAAIRTEKGILVDRYLETSAPGVYAAGDVARYPDPITGQLIRVEHWVLAQRQARAAALNMMGKKAPFDGVPFFWSNHYDVTIGFTGYAPPGSQRVIEGSLKDHECLIAYRTDGRFTAVATIGRDQDALRVEVELERKNPEFIEVLLKSKTQTSVKKENEK